MRKFPFYQQPNIMDCGPACLRMIASYYGRHYQMETLRQATGYSKIGVSLLAIKEAAESLGFAAEGIQVSWQELATGNRLPCILHCDQSHFVVLIGIRRANGANRKWLVDLLENVPAKPAVIRATV